MNTIARAIVKAYNGDKPANNGQQQPAAHQPLQGYQSTVDDSEEEVIDMTDPKNFESFQGFINTPGRKR